MSIARHHAEWLSLVPVSGPFLSLPVLMEAFNTGLEPHDPAHSRLLRQEYGVWQASLDKGNAGPASHQNWIKFILTNTLELDERVLNEGQAISQTLQVEILEHHELLKPSIVVNDPNTGKPRLLVQIYPRSQELSSYFANSRWKASPDTRMTELLHATGVRLGLVTNGEHWMLIDAPKGETTGYASWYASLWLEEPLTLRAFRSLLSASRFFNVPDDQTLEALLTKSASNQQEVTEQLGYQVRRAVEVLIHSLDKADQDFGRELLAGVKEEVLYESALTIMMRLVFLFCAEERELIPSKPFPVYEQNYSVSTISKQLRELADQHGEELLERRYDAWPRLLAAFRAVYGGLRHDDVHIPAYGGSLFNPDRFPFLEGRTLGTSWHDTEAVPLPVNNRTVLHLLEALQMLQIKVPGGGPMEARRISFRALDIEQIGHVYEGLLDHTAKRASEPFLGLAGTRSKEPEIPLAKLEELLEKSESDLIKLLKDETGKSENALQKAFKAEIDLRDESHFRTVCEGNDILWYRVKPFAGLIRFDDVGYPVVIPKGSVFVTAGTDRRSSGTHYTPRSLTEPIVQYTLEPLVYVGPAEGKPKSEWQLKSPKELLELKICDMACGSGAFLVQAARYMSERLLEAWDETKQLNPNTPEISPEGTPSAGKINETLIPDDPDERKTYAMRLIAQRCLYGVDKNPLAVEMAKLSLWLLTLAKDKPFEFLDHAIRCGDSLIGIHDIEQLKEFSLRRDEKFSFKWPGEFEEPVDAAINLRLKLEGLSANSIEDIEQQEQLLKDADEKISRLRAAADLLVVAEFWGVNAKDRFERVRHAAVQSGYYIEKGPTEDFKRVAAKESRGQILFHWPLEFPEVIINRGGFDAVVGNPPFLGGKRITGTLGNQYRDYLVQFVASNKAGSSDLCAYFFLRGTQLLGEGGLLGFLSTNTISEGDTREVGLEQILENGASIPRAVRSQKWPGSANLEIAQVWIYKSGWPGIYVLDDDPVLSITAFLTSSNILSGSPHRLASNQGLSFIGCVVLGKGFILSPDEAKKLAEIDSRNREVLFPYINGNEINSFSDQKPRRWIINFFDWPLNRKSAPLNYVGPLAESYPACLQIVVEKVKPERDKKARKVYRERWWQYAEKQTALYEAATGMKRIMVKALTSKHHAFSFVPTGWVYDQTAPAFIFDDWGAFAILQSDLHYKWALEYGMSLENRPRYTPTDCFETFPFPVARVKLAEVGELYSQHRHLVMINRNEGLTKIYNRLHTTDENSPDIQKFRDLHSEMNKEVGKAYGWTDIKLSHGFHETKNGMRFTMSESARCEVLQRLLRLNHERYDEEVKQGLHDKKKVKKKAVKIAAKQKLTLFDMEEGTDDA